MSELEQETLSPTKRALLAVKKLQAQVDALQYQRTEPIAIIGMACRFPGGVNSPEQYWELLARGGDAITEVPAERWDVDAYYDADPAAKGKIYNRYGGFIADVDKFDPQFFGISPREAEMLDPQQRLWLEVCWEALERAGIPPFTLRDTPAGIFASSEHLDYLHLAAASGQELNLYTGTGNMHSVTSGRLAHFLGTQGPAVTMDTACSASLVAIHFACQALRTGDCNLALAGGVNLILNPLISSLASQGRVFAPDGRCKTFSAAADGYTRSEGCGVLVLKRLSDAQQAGDAVLAVIRGTAVNHDGHSSGLTVPNGISQQKLIRQALANAGVTPDEISYVEAHGTGTVLGDPIEIDALGAVFGERTQPLLLGAVKTNIGHTEAAAGVAGVMKVVLALQHDVIPPQIHFQAPNPHIPWAQLPFVIPTTPQAWPTAKRLAGISSFSLSGTNAHAIIEAAPQIAQDASEQPVAAATPYQLLTLSAKSEKALTVMAKQYADHFATLLAQPAATQPSLAAIAYTTQVARSHFEHRLSVVASSLAQAHQTLTAFDRGQALGGIYQGTPTLDPPKIAFLFPGQGAQYVNMGRQLYTTQPIFRQAIDECDQILQRYLGRSLLPLLYPDLTPATGAVNGQGASLYETKYAQPALFTVCYALTQLWAAWGVQPDLVIGHSTGEYIAACVAGVFSLEDSLKLVVERSQLMHGLPAGGEMVAVMASEATINTFLAEHPGLTIAAINGPESVVLSGLQSDVQAALTALQQRGLKTKVLAIPLAAHSLMMEPILDDLEQAVRNVARHIPRLPLVSSPFGSVVSTELTDPAYWRRHLRHPVRFADGVRTLHEQGCNFFIEISPKPVLLNTAQQCVPGAGVWVTSLREGQDDWQQLLSSIGVLYAHGLNIDWRALHGAAALRKVMLPTYPFQRRHYWVGNGQQGSSAVVMPKTPLLDLLQQGNTQGLTELLQRSGQFTATETPLLQKAMQVLVQQQTQLAVTQQNTPAAEATIHTQPALYQLSWQAQPRQESSLPLLTPGVWLILADQAGVGCTLAELLREHDQTCYLIYAGDHYQQDGETWTVNPSAPAEFVQLCQACRERGPIRGVIQLWGLDSADASTLIPETLATAQALTLGGLLHMSQALLKQGEQPRIWGVTRGAVSVTASSATEQSVAETQIAVAQSSLWGLGRSLALELPDLWGGLLDLDPVPPLITEGQLFMAAATILTELWDAQGEAQLAYRNGMRYAARLVEATPVQTTESRIIHPDATYLITGGLGALGLHVARWLVTQGANHLVLIGRRGLGDQANTATSPIAPLTAAGCTVQVLQADVAQANDVARVLATIAATMPPLRGVIHTAGVIDDGILLQQNWSRFQTVLAPKVTGSWQLYTQTATVPLDFMVFFSSAAALLGSAGQSNYAAANAFMDALAEFGQHSGRRTLSIGWGSWGGAGLAEQRAGRGETLIAPQRGLEIMQSLLTQSGPPACCSHVGVMAMDWYEFSRTLGGALPYLAKLDFGAGKHADDTVDMEVASVSLRTQLTQALPDERPALLGDYLKTEVARVLGAYELPEARQRFFDIGMDSLMALQLSTRLRTALEIPFPTTLVFEYPSVDLLTRYLLNDVLALNAPPLPTAVQPAVAAAEASAASIQQMSTAELEALIDQELASLLGSGQ